MLLSSHTPSHCFNQPYLSFSLSSLLYPPFPLGAAMSSLVLTVLLLLVTPDLSLAFHNQYLYTWENGTTCPNKTELIRNAFSRFEDDSSSTVRCRSHVVSFTSHFPALTSPSDSFPSFFSLCGCRSRLIISAHPIGVCISTRMGVYSYNMRQMTTLVKDRNRLEMKGTFLFPFSFILTFISVNCITSHFSYIPSTVFSFLSHSHLLALIPLSLSLSLSLSPSLSLYQL